MKYSVGLILDGIGKFPLPFVNSTFTIPDVILHPSILLYRKIFAGLGTKQNLVIENGNGTYLGCGTPEDFTRLVVNNKWVVVEHFTNGTIDNIVKLYDTVQH